MSLTRGTEILPSGLTTTSMVNSLLPHTDTWRTSSGPIRYPGALADDEFSAIDIAGFVVQQTINRNNHVIEIFFIKNTFERKGDEVVNFGYGTTMVSPGINR